MKNKTEFLFRYNRFIINAGFVLLISWRGAAAAEYSIDASHSYIGFAVKHMVVASVKGAFSEFSGTINIDEKDITRSSADVKIEAKSIDTRSQKRDDHLRGPDFFDVEKFPAITFTSNKVTRKGNDHTIHGTFTMHGVSREISIPFTISKPVKNPWGKYVVGISGKLKINREDYGLTYNSALETGGFLIGKEVEIELELEAVKN